MSDRLSSFINGLGLSLLPDRSMTEEQRLAWYKKYNIEPPPVKPSPLKRAAQWVQEKLATSPSAAAPVSSSTPAASANDVGLMERLKAGNIDQYGSEAYNRWGQGKTDGDASELAREAARTAPTDAPPQVDSPVITKEMFDQAPEYRQSNPDWDGLPGDEYAMKMGA